MRERLLSNEDKKLLKKQTTFCTDSDSSEYYENIDVMLKVKTQDGKDMRKMNTEVQASKSKIPA